MNPNNLKKIFITLNLLLLILQFYLVYLVDVREMFISYWIDDSVCYLSESYLRYFFRLSNLALLANCGFLLSEALFFFRIKHVRLKLVFRNVLLLLPIIILFFSFPFLPLATIFKPYLNALTLTIYFLTLISSFSFVLTRLQPNGILINLTVNYIGLSIVTFSIHLVLNFVCLGTINAVELSAKFH